MIPIAYNLGSLSARRTTTATAVLGIGLVVFVLAAANMLAAGVKRALGLTGSDDVGMVIRKGSDAEISSNFEIKTGDLVLSGPEVKRGADGAALGVAEVVVVAALEVLGTDGGISNVTIRGVTDNVYAVRPEVRIVEGRPARPGTDEAVIGRKIRGRFKGVELGEALELRKNRTVKVVGVLEDGGSAFESEVWTDVDTLRTSFGRQEVVSSVRARLTDASAFDAFKERVEKDKQLGLEAMRESQYYEKQSEMLGAFVGTLGTIIAVFFSIGAMIGAMITMYASVASRQREIGTLRALGFSRLSVLGSFVLEAVIISFLGGAVGCAAALLLGLVQFSMMNFATWSEVVFTFHPTPTILAASMIAAVVMGVLGGFLPAVRAARLRTVEAMRGE